MSSPVIHASRREKVVVRIKDDVLQADSLPRRLVALAIEAGADALHLDFAAVEVPTASGVGKLVSLYRELRAAGVDLVLVKVEPGVCRVLQATGLTRLVAVRP